MNPEESQKYNKTAMMAGVICSFFVLLFFIGLVSTRFFFDGSSGSVPRFVGIACGVGCIGAISSAVICIASVRRGWLKKAN